MSRVIGAAAAAAVFLMVAGVAAAAEPLFPPPPVKVIPREAPVHLDALRVCSDPNNLPFSNERQEGFENKIASLLARQLAVPLRYTWRAQRRGFIRNTLRADVCDLVMGIPTGYELVSSTRPYYRSTYVFLTRAGEPPVRSLDDPILRQIRIGVHLIGDDGANSPGAHALAKRGIIDNVVGYSIYGDYSLPDPPARLVTAVALGEVDAAIIWGPYAGYFAPRQNIKLRIQAVTPSFDPPGQAFVFSISMGVKRGNYALRRRLNDLIREHGPEINGILDAYGIPHGDND